LIEKIGYDPQCALLEVVLVNGGQVFQYEEVPEDVWYRLRATHHPDEYYRRKICGCYHEIDVSAQRRAQNEGSN